MLEARPGPAERRPVAPTAARKPGAEEAGRDGDDLVCASCEHRITSASLREERGGGHEHTFVNPGGFVHHIGCFAAAPGCAYRGAPETAFSWFPGWSWQIAECAQCGTHIGWLFRCAGEQFHGLLVDKLKPREG